MVSRSVYFIPQPKLAHGSGQPGLLLCTPAESGSWGWSARDFIYCILQLNLIGIIMTQYDSVILYINIYKQAFRIHMNRCQSNENAVLNVLFLFL